MFRKSLDNTDTEIFGGISQNLSGIRQKKYNDNKSWHNVFFEQITSKINEKRFEVLFSKGQGRPNASIRILLSMMVMKEGKGWSDEQLFEESQFNMLVMRALGLNNINDSIPSMGTYYNFKRALYCHQVETAEDLIGEEFKGITKTQAELYGVKGDYTRMDSTLIGSNIAKCSRLQLIINVLQVFYKDIKDSKHLMNKLKQKDREKLETLCSKSSEQIVYGLNNKEREEMIEELGYLLLRIQERFRERHSEKYHLITRILTEQYTVELEKNVILKPAKEVSAESLQSAFDEDATYRNKNGEQVQGYSANLTETANATGLNLVTDAKVKEATSPDNDFFREGIENTEAVIGKVNNSNADGAYHSPQNQEFAEDNHINLILSSMQGREGTYSFQVNESGAIEVIITETGEVLKTEITKKGTYKIKDGDKTRYFSQQQIESYKQRQQIKAIPQQEKNRRNNVEATMFQLVYYTRNKKTRYRGLIKHQMWAFFRCLWINLVRIKNWIGKLCPNGDKNGENQGILTKSAELLTIFSSLSKMFWKITRLDKCILKKYDFVIYA